MSCPAPLPMGLCKSTGGSQLLPECRHRVPLYLKGYRLPMHYRLQSHSTQWHLQPIMYMAALPTSERVAILRLGLYTQQQFL